VAVGEGPVGEAGRVRVRRARTPDVAAIRGLLDIYTADRRLLSKPTVTLYEDVQEFWVAEVEGDAGGGGAGAGGAGAGAVVGCGALHVMWEDLAEVRTLAVEPAWRGSGIGGLVLVRLLDNARELGVRRVFCLTFETAFFGRHGFTPIRDVPVAARVERELLQSADEGIAEFLDLARVKPNTLGNTRMIADLG
jgi:amino-acid N-acetyltransferase